MPNLKYATWQGPYPQALLKLDPARFRQKIQNAEAAIFSGLQQLTEGEAHAARDQEKRLAINDAISSLRALRNEVSRRESE